MKILNVRLGHATNSSSSHSLIFLPRAQERARDIEVGEGYHWNDFQLVSPQAKRDYLAELLYQRIHRMAGADVARDVSAAWTGGGVPSGGGIDHQSVLSLPCSWDGTGVDKEFFTALAGFVSRDDVVIGGGNDNDYVPPPSLGVEGARDLHYRSVLPMDSDAASVARYDAAHGYWALFQRATGAKVRVTFDATGLACDPSRSSVPELVDLKITDHCPYGCNFCYQGSTPDGKHASVSTLFNFADYCGRLRVFEVAIGGGEPTLHPQFVEILGAFRTAGVVPNFTTKNLAWLRDVDKRAMVLAQTGGFAYSVDTAADVAALATALAAAKLEPADDNRYASDGQTAVRVHVQHVIGLDETPEQFETLLRTASDLEIPVTLLGFKTTGRGAVYGDHTNPQWLKIVRDVYDASKYGLKVSIDTVLAARYRESLRDAGVPDWCLTVQDGRHSCYFDAVEGQLKPSSYEPPGGRAVPMDFGGLPWEASLSRDMSETHFLPAYRSFAE